MENDDVSVEKRCGDIDGEEDGTERTTRKRPRESDDELTAATRSAMSAMRNACCKHSKYRVGACLVATNGRMHTGINVERDSYGLTCCAERVALFKALSEGDRDFRLLTCATQDGGMSCGACRQLLAEYCPSVMRVVFVDGQGRIARDTTVGAMLPDAFVLRI